MEGLTERQSSRLMELVCKRLREVDLEAPEPGEREPIYTARCLLAPVRQVLGELGITGLAEAGEGGARVRHVPLFGLQFYPDLAVSYHGSSEIAFEVKYLGRGGRSGSVATALGQAYLYRQARYRRAGAFLIDRANVLTDDEIKRAEEVCRSASIEVVVRRQVRGLLVPHPG